MEALSEMLKEAESLEKTLKQCVEVGTFMIEKNKELIEDNRRMQS